MKTDDEIISSLFKAKSWIRKSHKQLIENINDMVELTSLHEDQGCNLLEFGFGNGRSTYLLSPYF